MLYLAIKAGLSGIIIAIVSEVAKRYPGFGALIASLPLVSVLGMIWLWHDKPDVPNMAAHVDATFWFVLPSLPMFLLMPALLRQRPRVLDVACDRLRADDCALFADDLGRSEVRREALGGQRKRRSGKGIRTASATARLGSKARWDY